jgi:DNA-binding YbaB/EbfC family protein
MQQMMMQAQKMQRELKKAKDELAKQEFSVSKSGLVTVTMKGDKTLFSVNIDEEGYELDNKEMVEELIVSAINELIEKIDDLDSQIEAKITGRPGGFGF